MPARSSIPLARGPRIAIHLLGLLLAAAAAAPVTAETVQENLWVTNGYVNTIVYSSINNAIYLGGEFTQVGPATGGIVSIDTASGAALQPYWGVIGDVYAVAPDGSGGWFIGGSFRAVRGQVRTNLAQIDGNGNLTPWAPAPDGQIYDIAVSGSTVYVGGFFHNVSGSSRGGIAAIDVTSGAVSSWNPGSLNALVNTILVSGSTVYVGGQFQTMGGQPRGSLAAVDAATGLATSWNPALSLNASVEDMVFGPVAGAICVGGSFSTTGDVRLNLAAISLSTGAPTSWHPDPNGVVRKLAIMTDGIVTTGVYAVGSFTLISGAPRNNAAAIDASSGLATGWNPNVGGIDGVTTMTVSGNTVYLGGSFSSVGGQPKNYLAAVTATTGSLLAWDPRPDNWVITLAPNGSSIVVGGLMTSVGAEPRSNVAAFDVTSGQVTGWNPQATGPSSSVTSILISGHTVYIGGTFSAIGGQLRNNLAAVDDVVGGATAWNPSPNSGVTCLGLTGSSLYVGGGFTSIGGQLRNYVAAVDIGSGNATTWNPNASNVVYSLAPVPNFTLPYATSIYVGGEFNTIGGQSRTSLASIDGETGLATSWNPGLAAGFNQPSVRALLYTKGCQSCAATIYVAGYFTSVGGVAREHLATISGSTGAVTAWNPAPNNMVLGLALGGGKVYAGGFFTSIGGQPRYLLAALDPTTGAASAWDAGLYSTLPYSVSRVSSVALRGSTIFAGGIVKGARSLSRNSILGVSDGTVTAIEESEVPAVPRRISAAPNPFEHRTTLRFALSRPEEATVSVCDVTGRLVRRIHGGALGAGEHRFQWDGRNAAGSAVASGIYFLNVRTPSVTLGAKVFRLR